MGGDISGLQWPFRTLIESVHLKEGEATTSYSEEGKLRLAP